MDLIRQANEANLANSLSGDHILSLFVSANNMPLA